MALTRTAALALGGAVAAAVALVSVAGAVTVSTGTPSPAPAPAAVLAGDSDPAVATSTPPVEVIYQDVYDLPPAPAPPAAAPPASAAAGSDRCPARSSNSSRRNPVILDLPLMEMATGSLQWMKKETLWMETRSCSFWPSTA